MEENILELEKRLIGCQEETKPMQRRLQLLILEEDEYRIQEEDQAVEEQGLSLQEETLNKEIEGLKKEIQEQEETIKILEGDLEQERQDLTLAYTQLSALKEKGGHIGREWERLKESLTEKEIRKKRLQEKMLTGSQIQSDLIEKSSLGEALIKSLHAKVNDLEAQIERANQTWEKLIKQKEDWETVLKETRGLLSEAERQENEFKMEAGPDGDENRPFKRTIPGTVRPASGGSGVHIFKGDEDLEALRGKRREFREKLEQIGEVNLTALEEYNAFKERYDFYHTQEDDLLKSMDALKRAIQKINFTSKDLFFIYF